MTMHYLFLILICSPLLSFTPPFFLSASFFHFAAYCLSVFHAMLTHRQDVKGKCTEVHHQYQDMFHPKLHSRFANPIIQICTTVTQSTAKSNSNKYKKETLKKRKKRALTWLFYLQKIAKLFSSIVNSQFIRPTCSKKQLS